MSNDFFRYIAFYGEKRIGRWIAGIEHPGSKIQNSVSLVSIRGKTQALSCSSAISFFPQVRPGGLHIPLSMSLAPEGRESKGKKREDRIQDTEYRRQELARLRRDGRQKTDDGRGTIDAFCGFCAFSRPIRFTTCPALHLTD